MLFFNRSAFHAARNPRRKRFFASRTRFAVWISGLRRYIVESLQPARTRRHDNKVFFMRCSHISEAILERAIQSLSAWENEGVSLDDCLDRLRADADFPAKAAVASILFEYFRHKAFLDAMLRKHAKRDRINQFMRLLVSCAAVQIYFQTGIAWQSAVNVAVDVAKRARGEGGGRFANAILRAYLRDGSIDRAAIPVSCNPVLVERWVRAYGKECADAVASCFASDPPVCVRLRPGAQESLLEPYEPEKASCDFASGEFRFFVLRKPEGFFENPALERGECYVQDPATVMGFSLKDARPEGDMLDLCAAPGGKTILLAELAKPGSKLTATDRSRARLQQLNVNLRRAGVRAKTLASDARELPFPPDSFDYVLADVPCSNTGVVRRRPDVPWRFSKTRLEELRGLQKSILDSAAAQVRPGGRLLYSTCSIEPEENVDRIRFFLEERPNFSLIEDRQLLPAPGHDGAYAALLRRIS